MNRPRSNAARRPAPVDAHDSASASASFPVRRAPGPVVVDVAGLTLTQPERERLAHPMVGGVILFSRNFRDRDQVSRLCAEIRTLRDPALLICVDHEGGRVQRFREGFSAIPPMRDLGQLWDRDPLQACREATQVGRTIGNELRSVGVDLSFTPVLDLDHGRSAVIGNRAFHADPRVVTLLARSLNHGLLLAGMANCGKHFPGHGWASADSHVALPIDERSLDELLKHDAAPYLWLGETLSAVMPAHVVYPRVDPQPAGFSRRWLRSILRRKLGFDGVIFSDDLTMEGAAVAGDIHARAHAALDAGCDMLLVCNRPDLADQLIDRLRWRPPRHWLRRWQSLRPHSAH